MDFINIPIYTVKIIWCANCIFCSGAVCAVCSVVLSETSGLSSRSERVPLSENHADSRAETTTSTTQGCVGSSSTSTTFTRNGYPWKELTTQSEKEYEQRKHKPGKFKCQSFQLIRGTFLCGLNSLFKF
jgi:hypothetical protein